MGSRQGSNKSASQGVPPLAQGHPTGHMGPPIGSKRPPLAKGTPAGQGGPTLGEGNPN